MTKNIYITATNCITPLGFDVATNFKNIKAGKSGIVWQPSLLPIDAPLFVSTIQNSDLNTAFEKLEAGENFSKLEKMILLALQPLIEESKELLNQKTALILSTTKGNIVSLKNNSNDISSAYLGQLAQKIATYFGFKTQPIVVSNACVSGILAVSVAKRLIQSEAYDHVFVAAADEVSDFVIAGFNAFQAMSQEACKPYSINRSGVSLGEAAAAVLISSNKKNALVKILGDGSINDANHISGPSRTGEGLFKSIQSALAEAQISTEKIDYISAHGTATPFNDEMEAIAFNRFNLGQTPVNSFKGYYGHTLGASGLLETVLAIASLQNNLLIKSLGFDALGVSQPLAIIEENQDKELHYFLKTASGFGGCNTAVIFEKVTQ